MSLYISMRDGYDEPQNRTISGVSDGSSGDVQIFRCILLNPSRKNLSMHALRCNNVAPPRFPEVRYSEMDQSDISWYSWHAILAGSWRETYHTMDGASSLNRVKLSNFSRCVYFGWNEDSTLRQTELVREVYVLKWRCKKEIIEEKKTKRRKWRNREIERKES